MKKSVVVVGAVLLVVLAAALAVTGVALANSERQREQAVGSLEGQMEELEESLVESRTQAAEATADVTSALNELQESEERLTAATVALRRSNANSTQLRRDYNTLYSDYERLYTLAAALVGQGSFQSSYSPIHCTSSTISGYYVYTDCY